MKYLAIIPSETIYGIMAPALDKASVERLYDAKGRRPDKPTSVLISSEAELERFGVHPTAIQKKFMKRFWPGPVTLVFETSAGKKLEYLHRGTNTLAFRVPNNKKFRELLNERGPLAASSANPEGKPPATTIKEAREYFGNTIDEYVDGGTLAGKPSTLVSLVGDEVRVLRHGQGMSPFHRKVIDVVSRIPKGKTMTYGEVAKAAGNPGAARAVGTIISTNFDPNVPCHRVVRAGGTIGEYNRGGPEAKLKLLKEEGALQ